MFSPIPSETNLLLPCFSQSDAHWHSAFAERGPNCHTDQVSPGHWRGCTFQQSNSLSFHLAEGCWNSNIPVCPCHWFVVRPRCWVCQQNFRSAPSTERCSGTYKVRQVYKSSQIISTKKINVFETVWKFQTKNFFVALIKHILIKLWRAYDKHLYSHLDS